MSDVNITFTIRYEQSLCILNIETPSDVNRFAEKLVYNLIMLIIVVPTFEMLLNIFASMVY